MMLEMMMILYYGYKRKPPIERNDRVDLSDTGEVQGPGNFGFFKDFATCGIIVLRALGA